MKPKPLVFLFTPLFFLGVCCFSTRAHGPATTPPSYSLVGNEFLASNRALNSSYHIRVISWEQFREERFPPSPEPVSFEESGLPQIDCSALAWRYGQNVIVVWDAGDSGASGILPFVIIRAIRG